MTLQPKPVLLYMRNCRKMTIDHQRLTPRWRSSMIKSKSKLSRKVIAENLQRCPHASVSVIISYVGRGSSSYWNFCIITFRLTGLVISFVWWCILWMFFIWCFFGSTLFTWIFGLMNRYFYIVLGNNKSPIEWWRL